eukprot:3834391-Prymnesium_polylepis.1
MADVVVGWCAILATARHRCDDGKSCCSSGSASTASPCFLVAQRQPQPSRAHTKEFRCRRSDAPSASNALCVAPIFVPTCSARGLRREDHVAPGPRSMFL